MTAAAEAAAAADVSGALELRGRGFFGRSSVLALQTLATILA